MVAHGQNAYTLRKCRKLMRADGQVTCVKNNGGARTTVAHEHGEGMKEYGGTWTCRSCKKRLGALGRDGKK